MPSVYQRVRNDVEFPEDNYELTEDGRLPASQTQYLPQYKDGETIDWIHEEGLERQRNHELQSHAGIRGWLLPTLASARVWLVIILTGAGVGFAGAWLDILVKW